MLKTQTEVLRKIKASAGVLKTQNALFEENKSPCGHVRSTSFVLFIYNAYIREKCIFRKYILLAWNTMTPYFGASQIWGVLEGVDDGKSKNSTLVEARWCETEKCLYYNGVAAKIRWVPPPESRVCGEIGGQILIFWRYIGNIYNMSILGKSWGWDGLVGEMFLDLVGVFLSYLEAPSCHI